VGQAWVEDMPVGQAWVEDMVEDIPAPRLADAAQLVVPLAVLVQERTARLVVLDAVEPEEAQEEPCRMLEPEEVTSKRRLTSTSAAVATSTWCAQGGTSLASSPDVAY